MTIKYGAVRRMDRVSDGRFQTMICTLDHKEVCRITAPVSVPRHELAKILDAAADLVESKG